MVEIRIESLSETKIITASPSESLSKILRKHGLNLTKVQVFKGIELSNETQVGTKPIIVKPSVSARERVGTKILTP